MKKIIIAILVVIFTLSCCLGLLGTIESFEAWLPTFINPNGNIGEFFYAFTVLGDTLLNVVVIAVLVLLPVTSKKIGIPVACTAIVSVLINNIIKNLVARPRPVEKLLEISSFSFPSGHAMNNMAIYLMLAFCIVPYCSTKLQRVITFAVLGVFPIIMGVSRIYFNVHCFSDVICGWCLGAIIALAFSEIFKKVIKNDQT